MSHCTLFRGTVAFVMWNWTYVCPTDCIPLCVSDSEGNASPLNDVDLTSDETGSDEPIINKEVSTITHSVVFKCIGRAPVSGTTHIGQ